MKNGYIYISAALFAGVMASASTADAAVSGALAREGSAFGSFGNAFGALPVALVGLFCAAALFWKKSSAAWKILWAVVCAGASAAAGCIPAVYLGGRGALTIGACAVILAPAAVWAASKVPEGRRAPLFRAAYAGIFACVFALVSVNLLKFFWGRPRPDIGEFVPWYIPQGAGRGPGYDSFPSAHTANAAVAMWCAMIPGFVPGLEKRRCLIAAAALLWTLSVAASRVVFGAHYMSDVIAGLSLGLAGVLSGRIVFCRDAETPRP